MSIVPENKKLREAVNKMIYAQYAYGEERVLFFDPRGVLREVIYPSEGSSAVRTQRAELLSKGNLGAVVHLSIADYHGVGRVSMVEIIGDSDLHTVVSWPAQGHWTTSRPDAVARWREVWGEEEDTSNP